VTAVLPLDAVNWFIMFFALSTVWYVMRDISRRLGEALRMRNYYVMYDLCEALMITAIVLLFAHFVLGVRVPGLGMDLLPLAAKFIFAASAVIQLAVTIKYWSWIVPEMLALRKK
jgi:hypothetical protein